MGHIRTPAPGLWLLSSRRKEPSVFALPSAEPCNMSERSITQGGPPLGTGGGGGLSLTAVRERPLILPPQPENKGPRLSLTGLLSHTHHGCGAPSGHLPADLQMTDDVRRVGDRTFLTVRTDIFQSPQTMWLEFNLLIFPLPPKPMCLVDPGAENCPPFWQVNAF